MESGLANPSFFWGGGLGAGGKGNTKFPVCFHVSMFGSFKVNGCLLN